MERSPRQFIEDATRKLPPDQLLISRRNLPHWELGGSTYFITYRCIDEVRLPDWACDIVLANWRYWDNRRYLLHAAVIMPDHVHALVTPLQMTSGAWITLETVLHTNKSFTSHEINRRLNRRGALWQDERYDRIVRNDDEFWQKWLYIAENPERSGLVKESSQYRWIYQNLTAFERSPRSTGI